MLRRDVGSASDNPPFIVQESGGRPTAHVVTSINIWPLVSVDPDWNEILAHRVNDCGIGVGRVVHNVAPVAPRTCYVQ